MRFLFNIMQCIFYTHCYYNEVGSVETYLTKLIKKHTSNFIIE